jgi:hypothetical protein
MIKPSTRLTKFKVGEFINKNGKPCAFEDCSIVLAFAEDDAPKLMMPIPRKVLGDKVELGDVFVEKVTIVPEKLK